MLSSQYQGVRAGKGSNVKRQYGLEHQQIAEEIDIQLICPERNKNQRYA